ncbi:2-amino-4-hydroxy-6-hydroxymethyldihydropteridine pyrophosphokinase [Synechococcus sp. PCC 6312]|nr:2-amino-4-hydroxy-6-hydroxymethyldihydropteridine pyrophosphokinase [Synechococcus sp. PCC 6312]
MMDSVVAVVGLGSNLGDSLSLANMAVESIATLPEVRLIACSRWYRTHPVGPPQPDYLNGCLLLETTLSAPGLLTALQAIETQAQRQRPIHWGPRTLDLDLILYGASIINSPTLTVPHPYFRERGFVLIPLVEIYPQGRDPVTGKTIAALAQEITPEGISLWPVADAPETSPGVVLDSLLPEPPRSPPSDERLPDWWEY